METLTPTLPPAIGAQPSTVGAPETSVHAEWRPLTRIAFRFCVVYFGLYIVTTQMLAGLLPGIGFPRLQALPPFRPLALWIGRQVFGITRPIPYQLTGSGDKTFDWLHAFTLLVIAIAATVVWSVVARRQREHSVAFGRFRLLLRFALGTTMLSYGLAKAIPLQMPIESLTRLVEPYGNFSPMGVLWSSIGSAPAYEIFVGLAETCSGLLLFVPLTAPLGALMALMNTIAIFTLNMTYDVPVKLFSFNLVLMSAVLVAPNAPRYFTLFIRRGTVAIRGEPVLGRTPQTQRVIVFLQIVFGCVSLALGMFGSATMWKRFGGGAPRSALYGIWNIDTMTVENRPSPALVSDSTRWRRLILQRPQTATFQRMNDLFAYYGASIDTTTRQITLTAFDSAKTVSTLAYARTPNILGTADRLVLDGTLDHHSVHIELTRRDPNSYLQRSRAFHWISEAPFNR